jgi:hypothetical protein
MGDDLVAGGGWLVLKDIERRPGKAAGVERFT